MHNYPRRRSSGYILGLDSIIKQAPLGTTESGTWLPSIITPRARYDALPLPGMRTTMNQADLQIDSSDSQGSSITSLPEMSSPLRHETSHLDQDVYMPTVRTRVSVSDAAAAMHPTSASNASGVLSDTGKSPLSPRSVPASPRQNFTPMPPLRLSTLGGLANPNMPSLASPSSKSSRKQSSMLQASSELAEGFSALHSATGFRGTVRESLMVAKGARSDPLGGPFSSESSFSSPRRVGPDGLPVFGAAPLSPRTYPVPFKVVSVQQKQAALAENLQDALKKRLTQDGKSVSDSGADPEQQRKAKAVSVQNKARFETSQSLRRVPSGAMQSIYGLSNDSKKTPALNDSFVREDSFGNDSLTSEEQQLQQVRRENSTKAMRNLALPEMPLSQQQPSDLTLLNENMERSNMNATRAERAESAPAAPGIVSKERDSPKTGFFAAAKSTISNAMASRFRAASVAAPSLVPRVVPHHESPLLRGAKPRGQHHLPLSSTEAAAAARKRSAWGSVSTSGAGSTSMRRMGSISIRGTGGGAKPIAEGVEQSWLFDSAAHLDGSYTDTNPSQAGSESYWKGGVAEGMEDLWESDRASAALRRQVSVTSFTSAASFNGPNMGAVTWLAAGRGEDALSAGKAAALRKSFVGATSFQRMSSFKGGPMPFWLWLAMKRTKRFGAYLLPSARVQARFEFLFEDMLGVSGRLGTWWEG